MTYNLPIMENRSSYPVNPDVSERLALYRDTARITHTEGRLEAYENQEPIPIANTGIALKPEEIRILEDVWKQVKGQVDLGLPPDLERMGWLQILQNATYLPGDFEYLIEIPRIVSLTRDKKPRGIVIPEAFKHASFENFERLCDGQQWAYKTLATRGPDLKRGLFIHGGTGTGKTHLVTAYARAIQAELAERSFQRIRDFILNTILNYEELKALLAEQIPINNIHKELDENIVRADGPLLNALSNPTAVSFMQTQARNPAKTSDVAFVCFDTLYKHSQSEKDFVEELLARGIVIIDDVNTAGYRPKQDFLQWVVEKRYDKGGVVTILTSNSPLERLLFPGYPLDLAAKVVSRVKERCSPVEFDTGDYREGIAERENRRLKREIGR